MNTSGLASIFPILLRFSLLFTPHYALGNDDEDPEPENDYQNSHLFSFNEEDFSFFDSEENSPEQNPHSFLSFETMLSPSMTYRSHAQASLLNTNNENKNFSFLELEPTLHRFVDEVVESQNLDRQKLAHLLLQNADINEKNEEGNTALHQAILGKNLNLAAILSGLGADLWVGNQDGNTPLHLAILNNNLSLIKQLLLFGSPTLLPNNKGLTAEDLILHSQNRSIRQLLQTNEGTNKEPISSKRKTAKVQHKTPKKAKKIQPHENNSNLPTIILDELPPNNTSHGTPLSFFQLPPPIDSSKKQNLWNLNEIKDH